MAGRRSGGLISPLLPETDCPASQTAFHLVYEGAAVLVSWQPNDTPSLHPCRLRHVGIRAIISAVSTSPAFAETTGGPYLVAAFFCEKVLREADGVLSFIRVVDRWTVVGPAETMQPTVIQAMLVILMKSGMHRGNSEIRMEPADPSRSPMPALTFPILFEGDDYRGSGMIGPLIIPVREPGVYWFRISVDGQFFTQVPLQIVYQRIMGPVQFPTAPPKQ